MKIPFVSGAVEAVQGVRLGDRVLTGDRPTGPLHLGHLAGSLAVRVLLQGLCPQTVLVADMQALTDHAHDPERIRGARRRVVADYLSVGIDPGKTAIALQSGIPELAELTVLFLNVVTVSRLERNPTVRAEIEVKGFGRSIPAGFLAYPVSQAADILGLGGTLVPVGEDQLPMIEAANEIAASMARIGGCRALANCRALLTSVPRLPGADGRKASKTLGNALPLSAGRDEISAFVKMMFTDPGHFKMQDPGKVEGNVVFAHLDAFDPDREGVEEMKARYRRGGLGDSVVKSRLVDVLDAMLAPMRERRARVTMTDVDGALEEGTAKARLAAVEALSSVRAAFGLEA